MTNVKFLIIRFSSIGDIVLTTPIVRCLKEQVENAEIHYLTKKQFAQILKPNPYISKIITLQDSLSNTIKELKAECYDYIIDLHNNLRTVRIKNSLKILSFTVDKLNFKKWLLVNFKINKLPNIHIVERYLNTLKLFDVSNDNKGLDYFLFPEDEVNIKSLPKFLHNGYYGFVIGAKHYTKMFPVTKIIELINSINYPVVLLGGSEDLSNAEYIVQNVVNKSVYIACNKYQINQSASLVKQANLIITNDTGLMHIAAAFKKPIISVWGNTVPQFGMYPYVKEGKSEIVEIKDLQCRPCSKIGFNKCPKKHFKCMNNIEVAEIIEKIKKLNAQNQ